jgi:signal transduction histidine kinase
VALLQSEDGGFPSGTATIKIAESSSRDPRRTFRFLHTESFRLAAIYTAVFTFCIGIIGVSVLEVTEQAMRDQIIQYSRADATAIRDSYAQQGVHEAVEVTQQLMAAVGHTDFLLLQQDGKAIAGNLAARPERVGVIEIPNPVIPGHRILGVGSQPGPGLYAFSGSDLNTITVVRGRILRLLLWLFAGALVLAALSGMLVGRSFVARMDAIARTCRAIMAGNLRDRIAVRGSQDELDRLSATINTMLDRIAALMDNLRQVSSDVAHDLRTPLSHLRQRLERARAESHSPQEYAAALDGAIAAADEMLSLFAALLRIAQIEGGARRAGFRPVDLPALLKKLRDVYGAVAEDAGHRLVVTQMPSRPVQGDPELLFQLLANLVENAIVHTPSGTTITVTMAQDARRAELAVQDDGPGIPQEVQDKIFRRFYRLDASRSSPGHGLGLALVAAVAELHGGTVAVAPALPSGQGLAVTLTLPLTP